MPKNKQVILTTTAYDDQTEETMRKLAPQPVFWLAYDDLELMPAKLLQYHNYLPENIGIYRLYMTF